MRQVLAILVGARVVHGPLIIAAIATLALAGCGSPRGAELPAEPPATPGERVAPDTGGGGPLEMAVLLERARTLHHHRGEHEAAEELCRQVLASPQASELTRTEAVVFGAELQAHAGDVDGAVEALESFMQHKREQIGLESYPGEGKVSRLLARLLNGWDFEPEFVDARAPAPAGVVTEIARMLPCEGRIQKYTFATHSRQNADILGRAISRAQHLYCEELYQGKRRGLSDSHSSSSWTLLPYVVDDLDQSTTLFIHDAAAHPIPARYADHLPCTYDQLTAAVEANRGLVALDAEYGLPRIVVAAPDNPGVVRTIQAFMELPAIPEDGRFVLELGD